MGPVEIEARIAAAEVAVQDARKVRKGWVQLKQLGLVPLEWAQANEASYTAKRAVTQAKKELKRLKTLHQDGGPENCVGSNRNPSFRGSRPRKIAVSNVLNDGSMGSAESARETSEGTRRASLSREASG